MHGCGGDGAWLLGGVCVVALGGGGWGMCGFLGGFGGACVVFGGHAWFFGGACMVFFQGVCMVFPGGMCGFFGGGHVWFFPGGAHRIRRDTVNERAVRILLECILVPLFFYSIVDEFFEPFDTLNRRVQITKNVFPQLKADREKLGKHLLF